MNRRINAAIQQEISRLIARGNIIDTRLLSDYFSRKYNTPKQRVCGNLSYLKRSGAIKILSNRPYSVAY